MGFSAQSPEVRRAALDRAAEKAKAFKRGDTLSASPMSDLLEVSWNTLKGWTRSIPGLAGCFVIGAQGQQYEFKPAATVKALRRHFDAEQARRVKQAERTRRIVGSDKLVDVPADYDLDSLNKMLRTISALRDAQVRDGALVDRAEVVEMARGTFQAMLQAGVTALQTVDPTGSWTPEQREAADMVARQILTAQQRIVERDFGSSSGGAA